jgi:RHS repeat-associated protein
VSASSNDSTVVLTRDAVGRVLTETVNGRTVTSEYDPLGRCVRRRTPSGTVSTWEFDAAGTPVALHNGSRTLAFAYDAAGRETTRTSPSGLRIAQSWDANDQLASQTVLARNGGAPTQHRTFGYRPDGNVTDISDQINGRRGFDLDPFGRINRVNGQRWSEHYQYDVAGNLTSAATHGAAPSEQWRYTGTLLHEAGALRYQYDPQGRVTRKQRGSEVWQYTWNADDQLIGLVTPDNANWRYRYDALGRRVAKERHAHGQVVERVDFVWDGTTLAEQITDQRSVSWDYDPSSHRPLVQVERAGTEPSTDERFYAIVTDLVGAPTELVDEHGNVAWFGQTTAWGMPIAHGGAASTPLRFPGQYSDPESGLNYNYFRYYDPETGRYVSSDPVGLAGGYAPHNYVPNPLVWLDPLGLSLLDVIKNGVRIVVHEYDADKPAHAHVTGRGREVRIGPNGHPIDGQPELTGQQRAVVEHYKAEVRKAVRKLGRRNQADERAEAERKAAAKKPCDG